MDVEFLPSIVGTDALVDELWPLYKRWGGVFGGGLIATGWSVFAGGG
jgi:hypothetical protein